MTAATRRPGGLLLSFYGDDFTGSTDALEAIAMAGAPAMLFLEPPSPEDLQRYPGLAAVGVAGTSRSRSPAWMDAHLPEIFAKLKALGAPLTHYKTCSTFDSAPDIGSIGRAAAIGQDVFGRPVLAVVGVTKLRRYVVFSTLFAAAAIGGATEVFRIDRHPTMSRHPVTPMAEADLTRHLRLQTDRRVAGFDVTAMAAPDAESRLAAALADNDIVLLDTFDAATTRQTGRLLAGHGAEAQAFVVGSSGVEYALADYLTAEGELPIAAPPSSAGPVERLLVVCGSCSPVTEGQIAWAEANGAAVLAVDTEALVRDDGPAARAALVEHLAAAFADHAIVVAHTARGPADPRLAPTRAALAARGLAAHDSSAVLGGATGRVVRDAVARLGLSRVVLAGGDSSSHAVTAMGVEALGVAAPMVPGAPLCRLASRDAAVDKLEVTLKGGQLGAPDYFARVKAGG
jgi:uncharacterized protein YgbK (DUF1537 family)